MNGRNMNWKLLKNGAAWLRCATACAALLCLVAAAVWTGTLAASPAPPNMLGVWQGFFQSVASDPAIPPIPRVPVRSEVTSQENRRINGVMLVGGVDPCWLTFNGTVAASDRVNLQGRHEDHHGVAKLDLHDFGDGAAVLNGTLALLAAGGRVTDSTLLLLRPFAVGSPNDSVPNPAASYRGAFRNAEGTTGEISAQLHPPDPRQPTSFNGQLIIVAFGGRHTFELLGTINALGRRIAIAQSDTGSFWTDALEPFDQGGAVSDQSYWTGRFTLELNDGTIHEATFAMRRE